MLRPRDKNLQFSGLENLSIQPPTTIVIHFQIH